VPAHCCPRIVCFLGDIDGVVCGDATSYALCRSTRLATNLIDLRDDILSLASRIGRSCSGRGTERRRSASDWPGRNPGGRVNYRSLIFIN
jgi:hypothetical protein